ncbi:hypothetical protein Tco_0602234 [Tanacetum coccineum]
MCNIKVSILAVLVSERIKSKTTDKSEADLYIKLVVVLGRIPPPVLDKSYRMKRSSSNASSFYCRVTITEFVDLIGTYVYSSAPDLSLNVTALRRRVRLDGKMTGFTTNVGSGHAKHVTLNWHQSHFIGEKLVAFFHLELETEYFRGMKDFVQFHMQCPSRGL